MKVRTLNVVLPLAASIIASGQACQGKAIQASVFADALRSGSEMYCVVIPWFNTVSGKSSIVRGTSVATVVERISGTAHVLFLPVEYEDPRKNVFWSLPNPIWPALAELPRTQQFLIIVKPHCIAGSLMSMFNFDAESVFLIDESADANLATARAVTNEVKVCRAGFNPPLRSGH